MAARILAMLQVSVFTGIGACMLRLLRKLLAHYPAKWRYALLLLLGMRLLIPFRFSIPAAPVQVEVPVQAGTRIIWFAPQNTKPQNAPNGTIAVNGTGADEKPVAETDASAEPGAAGEIERSPALGHLTITEGLMMIWAAGTLITLGNRICGSLAWRRKVLRYAAPPDEDILARARKLASETGVRCPLILTVRNSADGDSACPSPMLAGVFRPVLLLPEQAAETEFALRHELAHLRRRDLYAKLMMTFAVSVHWFNPLVRLLDRQLSEAMECACDEQVLAHADAAMRRAYSEAILAAASGGAFFSPLSTGFSGGLRARLHNIFSKKRRRGALVAGLCALLVLGAGTLVACRTPGVEGPDKGNTQPETPEQVPDILTTVEIYDLAEKFRFDLVPMFDEGQAPSQGNAYLQYVFFTYKTDQNLMPGGNGYVPKDFLEKMASCQFGVTGLTHGSLFNQWNYDGKGYAAVPMGGPEQELCIPDAVRTAEENKKTVYTVTLRVGSLNGGLPSEEDFAAARAAAEAGNTYSLDSYSVYTIRFWLNDGVPSFLSKSYAGDVAGAEIFDLAREFRFDYVPLFQEGQAPADAREYLFWLYAVNKGDPEVEKDGNGYLPKDFVDMKAAQSFGITGLSHGSQKNAWDYDGSGYAAVPQGMKDLPLCTPRSVSSDFDESGQMVYTVLLDFCSLKSGDIPTDKEVTAFRAALVSGKRPDDIQVDSTELFKYSLTSNGIYFYSHMDVTEGAAETPLALYYDYFRDHGSQVNPLFNYPGSAALDDDLMAFAFQNLPQGYAYNWEAGIPPSVIDGILMKYFGRTVGNYKTAYTSLLPSGNVQATGWSFDGTNRLVLQKLTQAGDGTYTGEFDVYSLSGIEETLPLIDSDLRAGRMEDWASYRSGSVVIVWKQIEDTTEPQGFYLRYVSIAVNMDTD